MTDAELAQQAWDAVMAASVTPATWRKNVAAGKYPDAGPPSQYGIAHAALKQIIAGALPAPVAPLGDARATRFTAWPTDGKASQESPDIGVCAFLNSDIAIVADPTWGKAFQVRCNVNSHNPWFNPGDGRTSAEYQAHDPGLAAGVVRWWAQSIQFVSGEQYLPANVGAGWLLFSQLAYLGITSPAIGLELRANGLGVDRNPGVYNGSKTPDALVVRAQGLRPLADFQAGYVDVIVGAKLTLDATGWIEVLSRKHGEQVYVMNYFAQGQVTAQADTDGVFPTAWDNKCGAYNGSFVGYDPAREFRYLLRGLTWHGSRADAEAALA